MEDKNYDIKLKYDKKVYNFPECLMFFIKKISSAIKKGMKEEGLISFECVIETKKYSYNLEITSMLAHFFDEKDVKIGMPSFAIETRKGQRIFQYTWRIILPKTEENLTFNDDLPF